MNQTASNGEALGIADTLTQMVNVLGFHDLTSFIMTSVCIIAFVALLAGGGVAIVRKRRERLRELEKIVAKVQAPKPVVQALITPQPLVKHSSSTKGEPVSHKVFDEKVELKKQEPAPIVDKVAGIKPLSQPAQGKKTTQKAKTKPACVVAKSVAKKPEVSVRETVKPTPLVDVKPAVSTPKPISTPITPTPAVASFAPVAIVDEKPAVAPAIIETSPVHATPVVEEQPDPKAALGAALKNTRGGFMTKLARLFSRGVDVSDADFEEMEAILFTADIGAKTAQKLLDVMRQRAHTEKSVSKDFLRSVLKEEMTKILESAHREPPKVSSSLQVMMFVGVNGAGKTTSIGKLGAQLASTGKKVLFGAGDTFRAAAVEQLSVWGQRVGAEVVSGKENSDSASVLFEAIEKAKNSHADYVLCDTAGRLHTKVSLMDELKKVHRVMSKAQEGAPHQVFLVIDATMGQNAINQAREFAAATPLTGVVLSKLDGTAKGGVALGIVDELKVPIRYIGIGERVSDLRDFDAKQFVDALFEEA